MLMSRIMGAFTFKRQVYADVEKDKSFTTTAWAIVAGVALLGQVGTYLANTNIGVVMPLMAAVLGVVSFAVATFVITWVGKTLFKADVAFDEMVRTLGLANVWGLLGAVGLVLGMFGDAVACAVSPLLLIGGLLGLVSWFIAAKEALDLEWMQTIITVVLGYLALLIVTTVVGGIIGVGAGVLGSFGG